MRAVFTVSTLLFLLASTPALRAQGLPTQDNELLLAASTHALFLESAPEAPALSTPVWIVAVEVGLLNRATSWLDAAAAIQLFSVIDPRGHFVDPAGRPAHTALWGGGVRAMLYPYWPTFPTLQGLLGLRVQSLASPRRGFFNRVHTEVGLAWVVRRGAARQWGVDLSAALPLYEGFTHTTGLQIAGGGHEVGLRLRVGF